MPGFREGLMLADLAFFLGAPCQARERHSEERWVGQEAAAEIPVH